MTSIRFTWNVVKAIEVTAYVVQRLGSVQKVKLTKLLYLADRDHFLEHGSPITGDDQYAMPYGPVPSRTFDLLDGDMPQSTELLKYIHQEDFTLTPRQDAGTQHLSASEIATLNGVIERHGHKRPWDLVRETHRLPEFIEAYKDGTSARIPYESILRHHETGDGSRFRRNRPVVSRATIAAMNCPFDAWD